MSNLQSDVESTCFRWNTCSSFNKDFQPCKTHTLSANRTFLRLQEEVFALRNERSALETEVDVHSVDHVQDDLLATRSDLAGNVRNDFVVLVHSEGLSTKTETSQSSGRL